MAKVIMVQGTMSGVGKSLLVAGLCRVFKQDGYKVAPFKSQNMALNSYITDEGLEMGRAQVMQAEAAGVTPSVLMNPILLKPTNNIGSQVIVNGKVLGNMPAKDYFAYKKKLIPDIMKAYNQLDKEYDIIVIEGAGSPAEINLKENDIVNMGMAKLADAPVILVGDIDRGGVFAQLLGTLMLLDEDEEKRVAGLVINKFRGDKTILDPGIEMLEQKSDKKVVGVVPYTQLNIDDEDSQSERFDKVAMELINIGIIHLPRISNISDFTVFETIEGVGVHYIKNASELEKMDMIIIPGSKNTIEDLLWMRENGIEASIKKLTDKTVFGICGGFQILGNIIEDPCNVEVDEANSSVTSSISSVRGMEIFDISTTLASDKTTENVSGKLNHVDGALSYLSEKAFKGYEIHHGISINSEGENVGSHKDVPIYCKGNVYGSYIHGIFDEGDIALSIVLEIAKQKGVELDKIDKKSYSDYKEAQYDKLADVIRDSMDMKEIYKIIGL